MDNSPVFFLQLASKGIFRIKDLYNETNETNWETVHAMGVEPHHYIYWASITSTIPHKWKILMKDADFNTFHDASSLSRNCNGTKITSRDVYLSFVQTKFKKPTAQAHFLKRVDSQIDWDSVYRRIYNMSIDPHTSFFNTKC